MKFGTPGKVKADTLTFFVTLSSHFYAFTTGNTPETLSWTGYDIRFLEPFFGYTLVSQCPKIQVKRGFYVLQQKGALSVSRICIKYDVTEKYVTLPYGKGDCFWGLYCWLERHPFRFDVPPKVGCWGPLTLWNRL